MAEKRSSLAVLLPLIVACGDPSPAGPDGPAPGDKLDAIHLLLGPITLDPGQETTRCFTAHLDTKVPIDVVQIDSQLNSSHHVIFYREDPTVQDLALHPCQPLDINPFSLSIKAPIYIGETQKSQLRMPPGVAYQFDAGAPYTMEVHFLNASDKQVQASTDLWLTIARAGQATIKADMMFYGSVGALNKNYDGMAKGLPPGKVTTLPPSFHVPHPGIQVFALTSHQHQIGSDFVISKSTSVSDPGQMLFRNQDWQHPPLLRFPDDGLLTFDPAKKEGLRWQCTYNNTGTEYVTFGQSAVRNEMCFLWAYYFPALDFDIYFAL